MSTETARVCDFATKQVTTIPAAELAAGMVRANVSGIEGEVYVQARQLRQSDYRHPPFDEEKKALMRESPAEPAPARITPNTGDRKSRLNERTGIRRSETAPTRTDSPRVIVPGTARPSSLYKRPSRDAVFSATGLTSLRLPTPFCFLGSAKRLRIFTQVVQGAINEAADLPFQLVGVATVLG
jgi:hypothetical protein